MIEMKIRPDGAGRPSGSVACVQATRAKKETVCGKQHGLKVVRKCSKSRNHGIRPGPAIWQAPANLLIYHHDIRLADMGALMPLDTGRWRC
jgi:hypothetical protein